jgi:L-2,4-diaminobutyrate transaminase
MDRHSVFHPLTSIAAHMEKGPHIMERGRGVRLRDHSGRELVDCSAGLWCVNVGYGRPEIAEIAKQAILDLNYFHLFGSSSNEAAIRLADKVLSLLHQHTDAKHLCTVFFGCSGSDANDTNYKLVHYYNNLRGKPKKKKIISRTGGYHGLTASAARSYWDSNISQGLGPADSRRNLYQLPAFLSVCARGRRRIGILQPLNR